MFFSSIAGQEFVASNTCLAFYFFRWQLLGYVPCGAPFSQLNIGVTDAMAIINHLPHILGLQIYGSWSSQDHKFEAPTKPQVPLRSYIGISQQPQNNKRQNTTETHKPIHKQNTDHKTLLVTEAPFTTHLHERCLAVFRDFITCCTFLSFKSKTCGCHEMTAKNRFYIQNKFFKSAKNTKLFTKSTTCHDKLPNLSRTEISDANHHDFFLAHAVHARGSDGHQNVLWSISYSHVVRERKKPGVFPKSKQNNPNTNTNKQTRNRGRHPEI